MNEQKPLGYVVTAAANRLQNGGVTEYIQSEKPSGDPPCRAVYLWPDPSADKLRARIRVLEAEKDPPCNCCAKLRELHVITCPVANALNSADRLLRKWGRVVSIGGLDTPRIMVEQLAEITQELAATKVLLAAESRKVGDLQTQLDRIPAIPSVPAMPCNGILTLDCGVRVQVPVCTADSFQQVVMRLARAINRQPMVRETTAAKVSMAARIEKLESDLRHEQNHVSDLRTEIGIALKHLHAHYPAETICSAAARVKAELDALQPGAAEWLDAHQPDGWGVSVKDFSVCDEEWQRAGWVAFSIMLPGTAYGIDSKPYPTKRAAEEALARSLGWTGGEKAQGPAVAAPGTARTPPVGSRGGSGTPTPHRATSCEGTAKAPGATGCDVKADPPQDCSTCMLGEEPDTHPGCVGCHGVEGNPRWQPEKPTKESAQPCRFCGKTVDDVQKLIYAPDGTTICDECTELCWELVHEKIARRDPRPDNCPLPAVGEWEWIRSTAASILPRGWIACTGDWTLTVTEPVESERHWAWSVDVDEHETPASGIRRTKAGAKRAAERAARFAWRVRNA